MDGGPDSFPCHLEYAGSSGLSGDTLHNEYAFRDIYVFNFLAPPPTIHGISRTLAELLEVNQVGYQDKRGRKGRPALHYAAEVGDETEVERTLKGWRTESSTSRHMRDVGEKDKQHGMNLLHYAATRGSQTIVRLILSYHAERARLKFHSRKGQKGKQPPKNIPGATPPIKLEEAFKSLLASQSKEHGVDALHYVAAGGHDNVAKVLLKKEPTLRPSATGLV
ncbi:hypothetical protein C7212DRAFT_345518 [Tuber magnatum]|uniref:Uncharacterized protein n=1 Tax=Tuber magnatum TaxID=42249 RepID=A0A317SM85_9PEZI|nr:hypothetical protein C7212DRAFT_345518 [Tuber magnatum]